MPRLNSESARSSQGKFLSMLEVFLKRSFEKKTWSENAEIIYNNSRSQHEDS